MDAVCRNVEQGESITLREDAIPDFKEAVQSCNQDSELLVACDTINSLNNVQCVYVNLEENNTLWKTFFHLSGSGHLKNLLSENLKA